MTRYTVKLFKDGEVLDYLNTDDTELAHQTHLKLREQYGKDNVWLCDVWIEFLVG